ncbi:Os11g0559100 [Oryza sativa Japonica Group]|uniref:non-specific serine/threonine protein kinase n=3 Tax=Oryza sativa subsp. japonica TaxID=39947 RepID=Q2R2K6_ORYSJ|nr:Leucine Rich Repeat family protein [Oryza sativa Japonica Group]EAZ18747.1 hypothetical protein OsJ_34268 [Oryza sativa Japonica Group]BAT14472.1 Os11g0559100 [Oryza sativa Japonica Group]
MAVATADGGQVTNGCKPRERDALLAFKEGITDDPAGLLASWRRRRLGGGHELQDCCRWRGVQCSDQTAGHVIKLDLRNAFQDDHHHDATLVGEIGQSLISLEHLEYLDLSMNNLEGPTGRLPEFLGSFKSLRYLNLSGIRFSGMVPPHIGNLSNLQILDLSISTVHQDDIYYLPFLYSGDASWLARLSSLQYLNLNGVNLSAALDWPNALNMVPSLKVLSLSSCSLQSARQSLPLLNVTQLEALDLSENEFNHPTESSWIWNLTSLKYLNLSSTGLYGEIPNALGKMHSLQVLDFSFDEGYSMGMSITKKGNMCTMKADLKNLCNLQVLFLDYRLASGDIAEIFDSLPQCSPNQQLKEVHLAGNHITGMIPNGIGRLTSLVTLDLFNNNITGKVPSEIGMLTNLKNLYLHNNHLDGVITEKHFARLINLKSIYLCYNSLKIVVDPEWLPPFRVEKAYFSSCWMGPKFPAWLQSQVYIVELIMNDAGIDDTFPDWFSTTFSKATFLEISNNQIGGELPTDMENMSVKRLNLDSNQIAGQIPRMPRNLTLLDISNNHITGHVPQSFCELRNIEGIDLSDNLLKGDFPQCSGMRKMSILRISNNSFSGNFPSFLQGWTNLSFLDLSWNKFSGSLPTWIGNFSNLEFLRLKHNMFSGNIPVSITKLGRLSHLDLACNCLSGTIPQYLSNLTSMMRKHYTRKNEERLSGCDYKSSVSMKGQELLYNEKIVPVVTIDLSSNLLIGAIPEDLVSLVGLINLNLSRNYLSGKIPYRIGDMQSLESLDISKNKLYGEIPVGLSNLTYLSYLNLSYNNLTGRVPSGSQLDTLNDQHPYDGNDGLCGPPLENSCSSSSASKQRHLIRSKQSLGMGPFSLGVVLGFIAGLWVVFCTLLFKKSWRVAYFCLLDNMYNNVCVIVVVQWGRLPGRT